MKTKEEVLRQTFETYTGKMAADEQWMEYLTKQSIHLTLSAMETYAQQANEGLREAAEELLHLHACEQEGLLSGKPTPQMWFDAVNKLSDALSGKQETEKQPPK